MPFVDKTRAEVRTEIFHHLVPLTLGGFRWGALVTLVTGGAIYLHRFRVIGTDGFFNLLYGPMISVAVLLGIVMFLNGWFIMHPNQKVVIASAAAVARGDEANPKAAACGQRVVLVSRANLLLSIPTIFFMVAASHYPSMTVISAQRPPVWFWTVTLVIVVAIEINALIGVQGRSKRPLDTVAGSLWGGLILLGVLYALFRALL